LRSSANSDYELSLSDLHLNYADGERTGNIILSMTNPNPVIALNWDLILPEGVSIDSDNLNFTGSRTNRNRHTIAINRLGEENKYRFIVYSSQNREIDGTSGELLSIPIRLDDDLVLGDYPVLAAAPNLIYVENSELDETAPACSGGLLTLDDKDYTGINSPGNSLSVYPNPVKRYLYIESATPVSAVELYSQSGVCVLRDDSFTGKIDAGHLADGFYLVKIYTGENVTTRKIMKIGN
jgi:hypothetical protein